MNKSTWQIIFMYRQSGRLCTRWAEIAQSLNFKYLYKMYYIFNDDYFHQKITKVESNVYSCAEKLWDSLGYMVSNPESPGQIRRIGNPALSFELLWKQNVSTFYKILNPIYSISQLNYLFKNTFKNKNLICFLIATCLHTIYFNYPVILKFKFLSTFQQIFLLTLSIKHNVTLIFHKKNFHILRSF
jgi:hypothetical protein